MFRMITFMAFAFAVAVLAAENANAQGPLDKRTYLTFNQPVTLPGVTLEAGTYLFRLLDAPGSRRVVQVLSEDAMRSYAILISIPAHRFDVEDPDVRFVETPSDVPAAIKIWWYPGETMGHEFIYPEEQSARWTDDAAADPEDLH